MKEIFVCILDYGSGNVKSVLNMVSLLTPHVEISNSDRSLKKATHIILPGVGAFATAMGKIKQTIPLPLLEEQVFKIKKPFLGICVGMQVLATTGLEYGQHAGLNWIPGQVRKINSINLPLPHIGWNNLHLVQSSPLTEHFSDQLDFYYLHSFAYPLNQIDKKYVVAICEYGEKFCAIVRRDNVYGVQFHPEKSQKAGKKLYENFLSL